MSDQIATRPAAPDDGAAGKVDAAKEVAGQAAERAGAVADEAGTQVRAVAREAKDHVRDLMDRGRQDLDAEATARSQQAAGTLRTFADHMGALAEGNPDAAGPLTDLVREAQDKMSTFAGRLEDGPGAVLDDVRQFARRQPVLFLASAGALGFLAGRFARARAGTPTDAPSETTRSAIGPTSDLRPVPPPVGGLPAPTTISAPSDPVELP
jgi:hypothetical protein